MTTKVVGSEEWKKLVETAVRKNIVQKERERRFWKRNYLPYIPIPILIGIVFSIIKIQIWGWGDFFQSIINWSISITLFTTLAAIFASYFNINKR